MTSKAHFLLCVSCFARYALLFLILHLETLHILKDHVLQMKKETRVLVRGLRSFSMPNAATSRCGTIASLPGHHEHLIYTIPLSYQPFKSKRQALLKNVPEIHVCLKKAAWRETKKRCSLRLPPQSWPASRPLPRLTFRFPNPA